MTIENFEFEEPKTIETTQFLDDDNAAEDGSPEFSCPVHGDIGSRWMRLIQDEDVRYYCMRCWMDFFSHHLPELKERR